MPSVPRSPESAPAPPGDDGRAAELRGSLRARRLLQLERAVETKVLADIRERQQAIPELHVEHDGRVAYLGEQLTPGCRDCCLRGRWGMIRVTTKCQLACACCWHPGLKDHPLREWIPRGSVLVGWGEFPVEDFERLVALRGRDEFDGFSWSYCESLLELDKTLRLMRFLSDHGFYQWLYTNGLAATEDVIRRVVDAGVTEVRFNLAATDCDDEVIANLRRARRHVRHLVVESPMYRRFFETFVAKRQAILDTGVDHVHLAELELLRDTAAAFADEGPIYRHRRTKVSPVSSRQLTYDLLELAARERWPAVVLDCSNETHLQSAMAIPGQSLSTLQYEPANPAASVELALDFYLDAVRRNPRAVFVDYVAELEEEIAAAPTVAEGHLALAEFHEWRDEAAECRAALERGLAATAGARAIGHELACQLHGAGDLAGARALLERLVEAVPDDAAARELLANVCSDAGDHVAAATHAEWCLARVPTDEPAVALRQLLAVSCLESGRHAEAHALFGELAALEPDEPTWSFDRAITSAALGDHEQARALFGELAAHHPELARRAADYLLAAPWSHATAYGLGMLAHAAGDREHVARSLAALTAQSPFWATALERGTRDVAAGGTAAHRPSP